MKNNITIKIDNMRDANELCSILQDVHADINLKIGRYVVDAKSILGVTSLGFGKKAILEIYSDDIAVISSVIDKIRNYIV